jgi:poly-beta-1,6-N-acetyl-D-glucosamine synthase
LLYFTALMLVFTLISLLLFVPYWALIAYYRKAWKATPLYAPHPTGSPPLNTRISVLVPARNEEANIGACLDALSKQSYPHALYEVIVIDDHSTDRTAAVVKDKEDAMQAAGLRVECIRLADRQQGQAAETSSKAYKKFAIATGISSATGELIVTTDADCCCPPEWLRTIAGFHEETGAKFIAAPVRIGEAFAEPANGSSQRPLQEQHTPPFLSLFQALDFITLQGITGAAVYKNFHSMCNGANLAYEKQAFYEVEGFKDIDDIPSGDDMLLMYKIYKKYPGQVFFLKNPQAIVSTSAETSWKGFIHQRIRWASKAGRYEDRRIFWTLMLVYGVNLLFPVLLFAAFWNSRCLWLLLILLILKTSIEYPFVRSAAVFFSQQRLMPWFPAMQPIHILYTVVIGWLGKFGSYQWKGRKSV